jgi:sugar phosphate isomerase/epimerase
MNSIHRRDMLQSSLAGLAVATTAVIGAQPKVFAQPAKESQFWLGLVTYLWGKDMDLPTVIDSCEKSGLLGVELRTEHKHGVEPKLSADERQEVRKRFRDSNVKLIGYGSNCEFHSNDPAKLKANIELAKEYIRLMHDCGGWGVKVKPNSFVEGVPHEKTIEQIGRALNEVAEYGDGFGQKIRVEVHGPGTSDLRVIRDIFRVADHPNVYVCWNSNDEDLKGDGLAANFHMVQDRLGDTVHVREFNVGDYPYAELFKLFQAIGYQGWVLLECRTDPKDKIAAMIEQREIFEKLISG